MIPMYNTKKFYEVFPTLEDFKDNYDTFQSVANLTNKLDDTDIAITYQLLYARYGNSHIANFSVDQFKMRVWQTMFQYGPSWVKELDIQQALRDADISTLAEGDKAIYNTALAPDSAISSEETEYINQQNVTKRTKSPLAAYNELLLLLKLM